MMHGGIDGLGCVVGGISIDGGWSAVEECKEWHRAQGGREHLSLWCAGLTALAMELLPNGVPSGVKVGIRRGEVSRISWGRIHLRDASAWLDVTPLELRQEYSTDRTAAACEAWALATSAELERLGATLAGTGASAAHKAWRSHYHRAKSWLSPHRKEEWQTEELDWQRAALFGGRTLLLEADRGTWCQHGKVPDTLMSKIGGAVHELPEGYGIWQIDMRSAYPAAMQKTYPDPHGGYERHEGDDVPIYLDRHGIIEATVTCPEGAPILPIRVRTARGKVRTEWVAPHSEVKGVPYTTTLLAEVVRRGGFVKDATRATYYDSRYRPFRRFVRSVYAAQAELPKGSTRAAVKSLSRRLYGRMAMGRSKQELRHIDSFEALDCPETMKALEPSVARSLMQPSAVLGDQYIAQVTSEAYAEGVTPIWSAITADRVTIEMARTQDALTAEGCRVLYGDTDSLLFTGRAKECGAPALSDELLERFGAGLGQWREVWRGEYATLLGSKMYSLSGVAPTLAGIPRDAATKLMRDGVASAHLKKTLSQDEKDLIYEIKGGRIRQVRYLCGRRTDWQSGTVLQQE